MLRTRPLLCGSWEDELHLNRSIVHHSTEHHSIIRVCKMSECELGMVAHAFNSRAREAEAGRSQSSGQPGLVVLGQPGLYRRHPSQKEKQLPRAGFDFTIIFNAPTPLLFCYCFCYFFFLSFLSSNFFFCLQNNNKNLGVYVCECVHAVCVSEEFV